MVRTLLLTALFAAAACGPRRDDPLALRVDESLTLVAATLAEGGGEMQVKRGSEPQWQAASVGTPFIHGDWLRTGPRAFVRVEYVRGGRLELEELSIVLLELSQGTSAGERESQVAVEQGTVGGQLEAKGKTVVIRSKAKAPAKLQSTSDVPLQYRLSRKENATEVAVRQGEGVLSVGGKERALKAGEASEIRDDEQPAEIVKLLAPPSPGTPQRDARFVFVPGEAISLSWSAVAGASGYRIQVARDPTFREAVLDLQQAGLEAAVVPADVGPFYWRIASQDPAGRWGDYSAPRRLFVDRQALADRLESPNDGALIGFLSEPPRVTFSWEHVSGAQGYRLVVSRTAALSDPLFDETLTDPRKDVRLEAGSYFWGVYAAGEPAEPLFANPRALVVKKVDQAKMKIPSSLNQWGD